MWVAEEDVFISVGSKRKFVLVIRLDFREFLDQGGVGDIQTTQAAERQSGCVFVPTFDKISWRLRQNKQTQSQNTRPAELESHRNAICGGSFDIEGQDVDNGSDK